jgi:hypothetical protein
MKISKARLGLMIKESLEYFGLSSSATEKEIDKAYKRKAFELHPDKTGGNPEKTEEYLNLKDRVEAAKEEIKSLSDFDIDSLVSSFDFGTSVFEEDEDTDSIDIEDLEDQLVKDYRAAVSGDYIDLGYNVKEYMMKDYYEICSLLLLVYDNPVVNVNINDRVIPVDFKKAANNFKKDMIERERMHVIIDAMVKSAFEIERYNELFKTGIFSVEGNYDIFKIHIIKALRSK